MALFITPLFASILGIFLLLFTARVIGLRGLPLMKILSFGKDEEGKTLEQAVRGHGNFIEYVPFFLILLLVAELNGVATAPLYLFAGIFTFGRILHGMLFCFFAHNLPLRVVGMVSTLIGLVGLIILNATTIMS